MKTPKKTTLVGDAARLFWRIWWTLILSRLLAGILDDILVAIRVRRRSP
jgi:hypothetical protein